jgi:hypothetical protein
MPFVAVGKVDSAFGLTNREKRKAACPLGDLCPSQVRNMHSYRTGRSLLVEASGFLRPRADSVREIANRFRTSEPPVARPRQQRWGVVGFSNSIYDPNGTSIFFPQATFQSIGNARPHETKVQSGAPSFIRGAFHRAKVRYLRTMDKRIF